MADPAHAGRGVGRVLGEHVLDWARAEGCRAMQLNAVVESNTRAVALWRSLGFETLGTLPEGFQHPEKGYLLIWLSCTAVSVTAVILTVHFVVGSTKPTPLVARSAPTVFASSTSRPAREAKSPPPSRAPSAAPPPTETSAAPAEPSPARTPDPPKSTPPRPTPPARETGRFTDCGEGGAGVHTIESAGGRAAGRPCGSAATACAWSRLCPPGASPSVPSRPRPPR